MMDQNTGNHNGEGNVGMYSKREKRYINAGMFVLHVSVLVIILKFAHFG